MSYITRIFGLTVIMVLSAGTAMSATPALGDVNGDGVINVLDIQASIAQALNLVPQGTLADLDETGSVDVSDVQNLINTALGTGGLLQKIRGTLVADAEMLQSGVQLVAVSRDGDKVVVNVDTNSGEFSFRLPVKKQWWFSFVVDAEGTNPQALPIHFPIEGDLSTILPLLDLSQCDVLDLGSITEDGEIKVNEDLRNLLGSINRGEYTVDADGNDIPDFLDKLLGHLDSMPGLPSQLQTLLTGLVERVETCIKGNLTDLTTVSLVDENANGMPDFVEPLVQCLEDSIVPWLSENGINIPPAQLQFVKNMVTNYLKDKLPRWIEELNSPSMADTNGNKIPDRLEQYLGNVNLPSWVDADGNGTPDFLEK